MQWALARKGGTTHDHHGLALIELQARRENRRENALYEAHVLKDTSPDARQGIAGFADYGRLSCAYKE